MGGSIKKVFSNPIRAVTAVGTFGTSELARNSGIPVVSDLAKLPETASDRLLGTRFGERNSMPNLAAMPGGQSPTDLLANTGGAPVLANVVMGVSPEEALAGFFGKNSQDGSWQEFLSTLSQKDVDAINSTKQQLTVIQSNTNLRNQAIQKVVDDFPNVTKQIAEARAASGQEFDEVTKGYMKQALEGTAAKYAAGGNLSSGAANEAFARVGGEQALNKLNYMGDREASARQDAMAGYGIRLGEVNALRDFQNTMLGQKVSEGFNAAQANLGRIQQGGMFNAEQFNQRQLMESQQKNATTNALFGALGSLGGSFIGGKMLAGSLASSAGNTAAPQTQGMSGYFNPQAPKTYTTSYGKILGGY